MKLTKMSFITLCLVVASSLAHSENYVGGSLFLGDYEADRNIDLNVDAVTARLGTEISELIAVETRLGLGLGDDTDRANIGPFGSRVSVNGELDYLIGAYGVVGVPTQTPIYPYALLGVTRVDFDLAGSSETETDLTLGLGAKYEYNSQWHFTGEYVQYVDKSDAEISGFNLGVMMRF